MIYHFYAKDYTQVVEDKVLSIVESLDTIKQCGPASTVIDLFEKRFGYTEFVKDVRDLLCDRTFELYAREYA